MPPSPASGPTPPPETVGILDLAHALDASRAAVLRALAKQKIAQPDRPTLGGHRRWSLALATEIVRSKGRPVPPHWTAAASAAGGGS